MKKVANILLSTVFVMTAIVPQALASRCVDLTLIHTTDVHGNFFPHDYINQKPGEGSIARVMTYIDSIRTTKGRDNVILLDGGDILQGQPTVYLYNFEDTCSQHIASRVYNFMEYDAITIGNHDVETGHAVYDRFNSQLHNGFVAANVIEKQTGKPYFEPYRIIERQGIRIAVLGLLTPAIPAWLPQNLWSGLEFEDMVDSARKWITIINENENPDLIVGLFHAGNDASRHTGEYLENASMIIAKSVPGFDIVLTGHDHNRYNSVILNDAGESVVVLNPANNAENVSEVAISLRIDDSGKITERKITGNIVSVKNLEPSQRFMNEFKTDLSKIENYVNRKIGVSTGDFTTRDAYFGPSAFIRLIHDLQLKITGAEISMAAPLSFDATIKQGDIRISDMFKLYKYENQLYVMNLSGKEVKDYLEYSYSNWVNTMEPGDKHILKFASPTPTAANSALLNPAYNFDSAAGIRYRVDVTREPGNKVTIISMENGEPFELDRIYRVAVNSYRGNGGGDHLTRGAGIAHNQLTSRIVWATDRDMRFYLIKEIETMGKITPNNVKNWEFVPRDIVEPAITNDNKILFSK